MFCGRKGVLGYLNHRERKSLGDVVIMGIIHVEHVRVLKISALVSNGSWL